MFLSHVSSNCIFRFLIVVVINYHQEYFYMRWTIGYLITGIRKKLNAFCNRHHQLLWNFIETIPCNFCSLSLDVSEKAFPSSLARLPPSPQLHNRGCLEERQTRTHSSLIYYSLLVMTSGKMPIKFAVFFLPSHMQPSLNKHFPSIRARTREETGYNSRRDGESPVSFVSFQDNFYTKEIRSQQVLERRFVYLPCLKYYSS